MKTSISIVLFLIVYNTSFSQDLQKFYNLDTIYICFKRGMNQKKISKLLVQEKVYTNHYFYTFLSKYHHNGSYKHKLKFINYLQNNKGFNIDLIEIKRRKKFLRKNKNKILTYKMLESKKISTIESFFLKLQRLKKTYYLIDNSDFIKNKLYLRKVFFVSTFQERI